MERKNVIKIKDRNKKVTLEEFEELIWPEMLKMANYLYRRGVTHLNVRYFGKPVKTSIISIEDEQQQSLHDWIVKNQLLSETINITMNQPKQDALKKSSFTNSDIKVCGRILIDIDTVRSTGTSATDEKVKQARIVADNVLKIIGSCGIDNYLLANSGNGIHILLEGDFENQPDNFRKNLLQALAFKFDTEFAKIDVLTHDPVRLTKLYGCIATKGEPSDEAPHRQSYVEKFSENSNSNNLTKLGQWVEETLRKKQGQVEKTPIAEKEKGIWIKASAKAWADHYSLSFKEKAGDNPNIKILSFEQCPLKEHTNSTYGFALIQSGDFVKAQCMHKSHENITIYDFKKKYPLPDNAKIVPKSIDQDSLLAGEKYDFFPYILSNDGVILRKEDGKKITIGSPVYISVIQKSVEDNTVQYQLTYKSNNFWEVIWVDGSYIQTGMLKKLSRFGLEFKANFENHLIDFLIAQKQTVEISYVHSRIGWDFRNDKPVLRLFNTYGDADNLHISQLIEGSVFDLKPVGTYDTWLKMVRMDVLGTYMEMMIAIGFASIVFAYLKGTTYPDLSAPLINLSNKTSTGKTTSQIFAVSLFSAPTTSMDSMNATMNSIIGTLANNNGIIYALDELATNSTIDITQLIYAVSTGKDRKRLNQDGTLRLRSTFSTMIITSAENPLSTFVKNETGIRPRIIEFSGKIWTKNAKAAENIKKVSNKNYGQAGIVFVERLFKEGHEIINEVFEIEKAEMIKSLPQSPIKDRVANNYALITTAAKLIIQLLDIPLRYDFIKEELVKLESDAVELSKKDQQSVDEKVLEFLISNGHHFVHFANAKKPVFGAWGVSQQKPEYIQINIFKNRFEEALKKIAKVENPKRIIQDLVTEGVIHSEGDRKNKRLNVDNRKRVPTFEFHLELEYASYFGFAIPRNLENQGREITDNEVSGSPIINDERANNEVIQDDDLEF